MRILIAADGSDYTRHMLDYVATHGDLFTPAHEYTVLTVVLAVPPLAAGSISKQDLADYYDDSARSVLDQARGFFEARGIKAECLHKVGHPADVIAETADGGKYDLIVMGSHGHSALGNLVMGSVATQVLARCKTPVLLVR
ncbi:universal stress protein [Caldimonas tepidiphila]|uniref:universal stress protein n=1 Tax=Caldimonas tepidiphila TaxID=2315841 RepID=UPI000E5AA4A6|nr:universal stress protein [Caldimonas tepidiphila]